MKPRLKAFRLVYQNCHPQTCQEPDGTSRLLCWATGEKPTQGFQSKLQQNIGVTIATSLTLSHAPAGPCILAHGTLVVDVVLWA